MVAVNYMTETDTEAIWNTTLETARFALIGVRMAEFCNFKINRDATEQIVNAAYTPILEQFCEEVLLLLRAASKLEKVTDPWDFIQANVMRFLKDHYSVYQEEFDEIRESLSKGWHYTESGTLTFPEDFDAGLIKRTT